MSYAPKPFGRCEVTQAAICALLRYDEEAGQLIRRVRSSHQPAGAIAGWINAAGYRMVRIEGRSVLAHRAIWLLVTGDWPKGEIDHIDGDRANNRWANLRDVPPQVNKQNIRSANSNNACGFLGVIRIGRRFKARLSVDGKQFSFGTHDTPEQAHKAYIEGKRRLHNGCTL